MQTDVAPLPCMTDAAMGKVFDLWSAHTNSGTTDEPQVCPDISQEPSSLYSERHDQPLA